MTREEAKELFKKASDFAVNYFDHTEVVSLHSIDIILSEIYNDHEAQLKAKNEENKELSKKCAEIAYDFENAVEEIEKLKTIIEEAIRKPMGVEPHSWSDYKMQKDNA